MSMSMSMPMPMPIWRLERYFDELWLPLLQGSRLRLTEMNNSLGDYIDLDHSIGITSLPQCIAATLVNRGTFYNKDNGEPWDFLLPPVELFLLLVS
eukprot:g79731.t1